MKNKLVGVNEQGRRVGESHKDAKISDHEVELIRVLHEVERWGYRRLAKWSGLGKTTVRKICNYQIRVQKPFKFKRCP